MSLLARFKLFLDGGRLNVTERYQLMRTGTSGTMSQFHMARDSRTGEIVGLKILAPEKTAIFEARFKGLKKPSEGEIGLTIRHPRVVKTLQHGVTTEGRQYILMEFVDGPGLNNLIHEGSPLLDGNRMTLVRQMAEAVGAVHEAGFIHRDICPRNFLCEKDGRSLKLIDFGLSVPATKDFMQPGNRTGTPTYMAPEIARRRTTDQRVDIFSLGVSFYQLCSGCLPWPTGDTSGRVAMLHDTMRPTAIREYLPDIDPDLARLIHQCMAIQPSERPASAQRIIALLDAIASLPAEKSLVAKAEGGRPKQ